MKKLTLLIILALFIQSNVSSQACLPEGITFDTQEEIDNYQTNYPGCTEIEGDVSISGDDITNLNGLIVVTFIGGDLTIGGTLFFSNPNLTNLTGLDNVVSIGGTLSIKYNAVLTSLTGMDNVNSIGGDMIIYRNQALTSLTGLENVTSIEGNLTIGGYWWGTNPDLANLAGLDNLISIGEDLEIIYNESLTSLEGLDDLETIGGDLSIGGNDLLTSLSGLGNLNSIGGNLSVGISAWNGIGYEDLGNNVLTSLTGLDSVNSIGGNLYVRFNDALTSLSGIDNIAASTIGDISIYSNSSLTNCEVQSVCDYLVSPNGTVTIQSNATGCNNPPEIANACGTSLPCLPFGNYYFYTQSEIDNFQTNYPNCTAIEGYVEISGYDITNLDGLSAITSIGGSLTIGYNVGLTNLSGLNNVTSIGTDLSIIGTALSSLSGLEGLTSIGGSLSIYDNDNLSTLSALENLITIGGSLSIGHFEDFQSLEIWYGNPSLPNLTGLDNLIFIGGDLEIIYNESLTSLTELGNLDSLGGGLSIFVNGALSVCDVQGICNYLANPNGEIEIWGNAPGCNSQEEVEEACDSITGVEVINAENYSIHPNPVLNIAMFSSPEITSFELFDMMGKMINRQNSNTIDITNLEPGMYFVVGFDKNKHHLYKGKIIKK